MENHFINGFSEDVSFTTTGLPTGSVVTFNPTVITADGNVTMSVSGLNGVTPQAYTINVKGNSTSINQNINIQLNVTTSTFVTSVLTSPANNSTGIGLSTDLKWNEDVNASDYDVQVATDSGFSTIISNVNVSTNLYSLNGLSGNTTYYWRVKPKNSCGEGSFSNARCNNFRPSILKENSSGL